MVFNRDKRIKLPARFLQEETAIYIGGLSVPLDRAVTDAKNELACRFREVGYTFLFLPDLVGSLSPDILRYLFPGQEKSIRIEELYKNIRSKASIHDGTGFLYRLGGQAFFHTISSCAEEKAEAVIHEFISSLRRETERVIDIEESCIEPPVREEREISSCEKPLPKFRPRRFPRLRLPEKTSDLDDIFETSWDSDFEVCSEIYPGAEEEPLDSRTQAILAAWERFKREYGVTPEDIDFLLGYTVKLSRLFVSRTNRIILTDWDGQPEVKLDDLTKSLYFFYLRHPNGIAFKELGDFEGEVYNIYLGITGRDDLEGIRKSIAGLVAPYSDVRNSCVSRIKKAFKDIVGDRIARHYYIDGRAGEKRSVGIDRDLVIWEN